MLYAHNIRLCIHMRFVYATRIISGLFSHESIKYLVTDHQSATIQSNTYIRIINQPRFNQIYTHHRSATCNSIKYSANIISQPEINQALVVTYEKTFARVLASYNGRLLECAVNCSKSVSGRTLLFSFQDTRKFIEF